jgi:putative membrane protein
MRMICSVLVLTFAAATAASAATAPAPSDFVSDAIKGDNSEIQLGKLAEDQGQSAAVKRFGRTLVADHTMAKDQMDQVARQVGVTPTTDVLPDADAEMQKLKDLKGADFDKEFASHMVDDHQKDIATFTAEADAKNGPASTVAAKQLPTLRKHLRMAQALNKG